jgi:hypothetical protein
MPNHLSVPTGLRHLAVSAISGNCVPHEFHGFTFIPIPDSAEVGLGWHAIEKTSIPVVRPAQGHPLQRSPS